MSKELEVVEKHEMLAIDQQAVKALKKQYDLFRQLQKEVLEEGTDYGYPAGRRNQLQKPSLYKSGAEKLTRLFGLIPEFEIIQTIEKDDFIMYKFRCRLRTRDGTVVGDGFGACNSKEKDGWNENPWRYQNNILKMAKKRAHVDAVLTGVGASNVFTQDIEDMEENTRNNKNIQKHNTKQKNTYQIVKEMAQNELYKMKKDLWGHIKEKAKELNIEPEDILRDVEEKFDLQTQSGIKAAETFVEAYKIYPESGTETVETVEIVESTKPELFKEIEENLSDAPF
ncbi:hypothetical protein [Thermosipho sp. 1074]|uniref:hypothetical protein n=1 Tax=Thermosipho sp. 1074 TaxID=1643331 RepID=UPI000984CBA2|nr:hypothetical protein [Thermosipho sp. 1074]OOC42171.1 hypothetical protein XO08_07755 [Thermosipho sp. 1074]